MILAKDIRSEPNLKVGIILPEDKQTSCKLTLAPDSSSKDIEDLLVQTQGDSLLVNGKPQKSFSVSVSQDAINTYPAIRIDSVVAGRGFHWQKNVSMSFFGTLHFYNYNGVLLAINELPLEKYLMCVATSEMGTACPEALIQAQTIVARSFILANAEKKHSNLGFDFCNDDCCQRYHGIAGLSEQSRAGSEATRGIVPVFNDEICDTRYSKSCGGMMESFEAVWNQPNPDYFQVIPDMATNQHDYDLTDETQFVEWINNPPIAFCSPETIPESELPKYLGGVDESGEYYRWEFSYSQNDLTKLISEKSGIHFESIKSLDIVKRGGSGRILQLTIHGRTTKDNSYSLALNSEYEIRKHLHPGFLYSSAFYVHYNNDDQNIPDSFTLKGAGWGHGAGLCQIGALGMALKGCSSDQIIPHYYPSSHLVKLYS